MLFSVSTQAEVIFDNTLGQPVTPDTLSGNMEIPAARGETMGANLFHSFSLFNINMGESATFTAPDSIDINHVISRVTGNVGSWINGSLISKIGSADFWFINPHGVVFGPNATLDIQRSFHVSTADYISLGQGGVFSATHPNQSLLTTAPPEAFGFLGKNPAPIKFHGSQLTVCTEGPEVCSGGEAFSIVGGDINITGGSSLQAPGGQFNLASVASAGEVILGEAALGMESFARLGRITIMESNIGDTGEQGGGAKVFIRGGQLVMDRATVLSIVNGEQDGQGIRIELTDDLVLQEDSSIVTDTHGLGKAGDIAIKADRLQLEETALINARTNGPGQGGTIIINADDLQLRDSSKILTDATESASRSAGTIAIHATHIELRDESRISSRSTSQEAAAESGRISIHARDTFRLFDGSSVSVETQQANAGNIDIHVGNLLHLRDGSSITTSVAGGRGDGGNITITHPVFTLLDGGSEIIAQAAEGRGGDIHITTNFLFQFPDSLIDASSELGIDGTVQIDSPDTDITGGIIPLPESYFDVAAIMLQACAERFGGDVSSLVARRYEVLPDSPYALRVQLPRAIPAAETAKQARAFSPYQVGSLLGPVSGCLGSG